MERKSGGHVQYWTSLRSYIDTWSWGDLEAGFLGALNPLRSLNPLLGLTCNYYGFSVSISLLLGALPVNLFRRPRSRVLPSRILRPCPTEASSLAHVNTEATYGVLHPLVYDQKVSDRPFLRASFPGWQVPEASIHPGLLWWLQSQPSDRGKHTSK